MFESPPEEIVLDICLTALFLAGAPRSGSCSRAVFPGVVALLRRETPRLGEASDCLRRHGFWSEALILETPGLMAWAEDQCSRGKVLTVASPAYPARWLRLLGSGAPPALWRRGRLYAGSYLGVVGSRLLSAPERAFAAEVGREAVRLGYAVVSGGAVGADRAAVRGARREAELAGIHGQTLEILPCGLSNCTMAGPALSLSPPSEPFTGARAMERNALIYALAEATVVVKARLREGGTWSGATAARRRHGARLLVRDAPDPAVRALVAMGARLLGCAAGLADALDAWAEPSLFASAC